LDWSRRHAESRADEVRSFVIVNRGGRGQCYRGGLCYLCRGRSFGGSRGGSSSIALRCVFADSVWHCDDTVRLLAEHPRVSKKDKSHGRFHVCFSLRSTVSFLRSKFLLLATQSGSQGRCWVVLIISVLGADYVIVLAVVAVVAEGGAVLDQQC
jgi:hypothetical protein